MIIEGNLVDVKDDEIYPAKITFNKKIIKIEKTKKKCNSYILPGLIDAHIHIESSMLCPSRFGEAVVPHGTVATVSDPHEIANVMGIKGIDYMIADSTSSLKIYYTAPSCVPATPFETSGACLSSKEIEKLMKMKQIVALGEMMNYPGVICRDKEIMAKIAAAKKAGKPVDGHAPMISGDALKRYVSAGISTEHEASTYAEVLEKAKLGMIIQIREGSSSHNMKDLLKIANDYESFLVSDDKHPEHLIKGHVNLMLRKAVKLGLNPVTAIKSVTINPSKHYDLNTGIIEEGRAADFVIVNNLKGFNVRQVFIDGKLVAEDGNALFSVMPKSIASTFKVSSKSAKDFFIKSNNKSETVRVIQVIEGQLVTKETEATLKVVHGNIAPDVRQDVLKIAVVERYGHNNIGLGFIKGFNLKNGAIASSVAHDSHNIIVVGTNEEDMTKAVNEIIKNNGGLIAVDEKVESLPLEIAGLMTTKDAVSVSKELDTLHKKVKDMGCRLKSPFMTLSFMALLVIPELKISDKGLFDVKKFEFVDVIK